MSLIHQVLRDIDQRQTTTQAIPAALTVPESYFYDKKGMIWLLVAVLVGLLIWFGLGNEKHEPVQAADMPELRQPSIEITALHEPQPLTDDATHTHDSAVPSVTRASSPPEATVLTVMTKTPSTELSDVVVVRHQQPAREHYLRALNEAQQGQWVEALQAVEQALAHESANEYLTLKLRIFLEQKNTEGFLTWYQQHQRLQNSDWWSVAAPGLHMHGYYDEAIRLYQRLQREQPTVVNWPLAQVLALKQAQRVAESEPVLRTLLQRYALTDAQQRWVQQQLQELTR